MDKNMISTEQVCEAARSLAAQIPLANGAMHQVWGIPRGGVSAALALCAVDSKRFEMSPTALESNLIVDDIYDTGETMKRFRQDYPARTFGVLYNKHPKPPEWLRFGEENDGWLVFPWEETIEASASDIILRMLSFIGEDSTRPGLQETPNRVIAAWEEWFGGYRQDPKEVLKAFTDGAERVDEMVLVRDIPLYSHCEHHLAPFFGTAHVAYIPNGKIVGLSKLPRLVDVFARRLQVQERLTNQVADALVELIKPKGVGVVLECRHLCMESRGIRRSGSSTVTSAMRGAMLAKPEARAELLSLVRRT